jgi:hypothetical protein
VAVHVPSAAPLVPLLLGVTASDHAPNCWYCALLPSVDDWIAVTPNVPYS